MSRIHPSLSGSHVVHDVEDSLQGQVTVPLSPKQTTLTVWKRSSMSFQGTDGFTVYDHNGKLAFRVDNYSRNGYAQNGWSCSSVGGGGGGVLVLMDGSGNPLLTLKPKILSIKNQWNACTYKEDHNGSPKSDKRIFMMRRPSSSMFLFGQTQNKEAKCEAEIFLYPQSTEPDSRKPSGQPDYIIEGSFWNRNCKIMSTINGEVAAKIMRKRTCTSTPINGSSSSNSSSSTSSTIMLSEEVFSLVVMPDFDPQVIMAFVVILDRICCKPIFTPRMCS
ncbi:protein LURP-one-related 8-like [Rutidosis leptorrhynchoides]|uniref:protein LURP-one-related 8-like n=1 Tax=Rutidosis leptorrhynchoides TaxID=125765 RepID=UPI003A999B33